MSGFPINLDLSEYFDDLRKYSSIFVNLSKCKDVRDVGNHIKSVFGLEDNICLVHKKFLIPKSEDIQILQQYDIFKVQKCNFYDIQIHKTKKVNTNSTCDQKALNLTQSEKTIDLSCRPKQRIKANICPSPGVSGTLTPHVDNKTCTDSLIVSPECAILLNGNHNIPKDKPKHKKKRQLQSDDSEDDAGNILDMSVKNSRRKKHSNCFSTDDGSLLSEGANDAYSRDITKDLHKKPKKRKKHSDGVGDTYLDLASTCWDSIVCDDASGKDQNSKKKSRKCREECLNESLSTNTNKVSVKNGLENMKDFHNNPVDDECSVRKKHKHKKYGDSKVLHDSEETQYYSSSPCSTSKNYNLKKTSISKIFCDNKSEKNSDSSKPLEEQKKRMKVEIDQMLSEMHKNSSDTNSLNYGDNEKSIVISNEQPASDNNHQESHEDSSIAENITHESCTEFDFTNPKRKRKRKHNRKKKKEKLLYMLAVGPTVNQLAAQPTVPKSTPSSEVSKHVFFTEDNFVEDMTIPLSTPIKSQTKTDSSQPLNSSAEIAPSQENLSSKPVTWQDQLLKLASSGSKPVVFHRNTSVATTNKQVSSPQSIQEHLTPTSNSGQTDRNMADLVQVNPVAEGFQSCNGEVKSANNNEDQSSCSGTVDGCSRRKGLSDTGKPLPIPNDLQNINLSDYPIIDKVVAEDLILFKVLKLNEKSEPGFSKPILARVNGTSNFPDRISLQIMEGCEECSHCTQAEESGEAFTVELRWTDILEPRLFYP